MKKGFTLVELLAVIVILAIILSIAIPGITSIIESVQLSAFTSNAQLMKNAAKNLAGIDSNYLPGNSGAIKILKLEDIQSAGYINTIKNPKNNTILCDGYVVIKNVDNSSIIYTPYLKCGTDYKTTDYIEQNLTSIEVLVVAGGGAGGSNYAESGTGTAGGGGGAGGLLYNSNYTVDQNQTIVTSVGFGGVSSLIIGPSGNGEDSSFGTLITIGGGAGASRTAAASSGGSGGGGAYFKATGGGGTTSQGNAGGSNGSNIYGGSGGGGASSAGVSSANNFGVDGGSGLYYGNIFGDIIGHSGYFAGGGGGGGRNGAIVGIGGIGGGGTGGAGSNATNALPNTGGGGGGSGSSGYTGGDGGSGIIMVRYLGPQKASGGTVTQLNGYTIHTFTDTGLSTFEVLSF